MASFRRSWVVQAALGLVLALSSAFSFASSPLTLAEDPVYVLGEGQLALWRDPTRKAKLADAQAAYAAGAFEALPGALGLGYEDDAAWLRFVLRAGAAQVRKLEIQPAYLDEIDLFHYSPGGVLEHYHYGDLLPFATRDVPYRNTVVPLNLTPGEHVLYLRLTSKGALSGLVKLWRSEAFERYVQISYLLFGVFYGVIFAVLLANLSYYAVRREPVRLAFLLSCALSALSWASILGLTGEFLLPRAPALNDQLTGILVLLHSAAAWYFFALLFEYRKHHPGLFRVAQGGVLLGVVSAGLAPFGFLQLLSPLVRLYVLFFILSAPWVVRRLWLRGTAAERMLAATYAVFPLTLVVVIAQSLGATGYGESKAYTGLLSNLVFVSTFQVVMLIRTQAKEESLRAAKSLEERFRYEARVNREAIAAREQTLGLLAHELRTPVAQVESSRQVLEMLDGDTTAAGREGRQRRLATIRRAVDRLRLLFTLAVDSERGGAVEVPRMRLDAGSLLRGALEFLEEPQRARLVLAVAKGLPRFLGEEGPLRFALLNLIENALKYSPVQSRVTVAVSAAAEGERSGLLFSVFNEGEPLAPELWQGVFEKYRRGGNPEGPAGLGLGLFLVRRVFEAHGGGVRVVEDRVDGVEFQAWLPGTGA